MSRNVAILISGGGSNMVKLVESLHASGQGAVCLVLADSGTAGGLAKAEALGVPRVEAVERRAFHNDRAGFEAALDAALRRARADVICLAGFMRVLSAEFVAAWEGRILNIHPSLLPKYKGLNTHARALADNERVHGCTVHEVTAALDDGPILGQARVPVLPEETAETLAARVLEAEHRLYPAVLARFLDGKRDVLTI